EVGRAEPDSGKLPLVERAGEAGCRDPGGAEELEGLRLAPAFGHRGPFYKARAGLDRGGFEGGGIGAGQDVGPAGLVKPLLPRTARARDDGEAATEVQVFVEKAGELAQGKSRADGDLYRTVVDLAGDGRVGQVRFGTGSSDGIRPV